MYNSCMCIHIYVCTSKVSLITPGCVTFDIRLLFRSNIDVLLGTAKFISVDSGLSFLEEWFNNYPIPRGPDIKIKNKSVKQSVS